MTVATTRQRPTRRQLEVPRAYIAAGSIVAAAHELGIAETTFRQHLSGLYRRTGCLNAAQAAYWLGATEGGWSGAATRNRDLYPSNWTDH
jgi:DNA-binding NarL/FixJ family response regulator